MKQNKILIAIASIAILLAIFAGYKLWDNKKQVDNLQEQSESLSSIIHKRDSLINEMMTAFNEIESDLSEIHKQKNLLTLDADEKELANTKKERITRDIQAINALLEANEQKIAALDRQLKKSGLEMKGMRDKISSLQQHLAERTAEMDTLKTLLADKDFEISQLNIVLDSLHYTVKKREQTIAQQTQKMNTAHVAYGSFTTLSEKGILAKEGGFLGIGKKSALAANPPDSAFQFINIYETKDIPVYAQKATLITEHPDGSYEFVTENEEIAYLTILNPDEFWRITKYAVVETN